MVEKYGNRFDQKKVAKEYLLTGNAGFRRDVLVEIGGFDKNLRGLEDVDLGIRVRAEGYELKYTPSAIVFHRHYDKLSWLIKRQYTLGKTFAKISRKYVYHFSIRYYLVRWLYTFFKALTNIFISFAKFTKCKSSKKLKEDVLVNLFSILIVSSALLGLIAGSLTERYEGEKYYKNLDFVGEKSILKFLRKKFNL